MGAPSARRGCCLWQTTLVLALALPGHAAERAHPGVVLHETHTQSSVAQIDTLHTYFIRGEVLIVHDGGRTLLDLAHQRIVVFDAETRRVRTVSLKEWEAELQEAAKAGAAAADETSGGSFEAQGVDERIAGFHCERYHHFGTRTLLGDEEYVEQQIWVTQDIAMPQETYEAYRRAFDRIESIGRAAVVQRPPGVVLAVETRTRPVAADRRTAQVERYTVYAVEQRDLPEAMFHIPSTVSSADSATMAPGADAGRR